MQKRAVYSLFFFSMFISSTAFAENFQLFIRSDVLFSEYRLRFEEAGGFAPCTSEGLGSGTPGLVKDANGVIPAGSINKALQLCILFSDGSFAASPILRLSPDAADKNILLQIKGEEMRWDYVPRTSYAYYPPDSGDCRETNRPYDCFLSRKDQGFKASDFCPQYGLISSNLLRQSCFKAFGEQDVSESSIGLVTLALFSTITPDEQWDVLNELRDRWGVLLAFVSTLVFFALPLSLWLRFGAPDRTSSVVAKLFDLFAGAGLPFLMFFLETREGQNYRPLQLFFDERYSMPFLAALLVVFLLFAAARGRRFFAAGLLLPTAVIFRILFGPPLL